MNMENNKIPQHVAIIMDGNGRWARSRGLPRIAGHRAGVDSAREAVESAGELGIKIITLYTFSTENWKRPKSEVTALFGLLDNYIDKESDKLAKKRIRFMVTGDIEGIPEPLKSKLKKTIADTVKNDFLTVNLALNYGSRTEIARAAKLIAADVKASKLNVDEIDEGIFSRYLYTKDLPDPDLLIRTSGEYRISNFMLWQISYAEIYITDTMWPDFRKRDLADAITWFGNRQRRFGG
ncbi:MAG: isoprenyl transferase [Candidatus Omnitrophica bacterium]|nr:isoprenyl transferase [Candidatus Omnitrophota bacterium]